MRHIIATVIAFEYLRLNEELAAVIASPYKLVNMIVVR